MVLIIFANDTLKKMKEESALFLCIRLKSARNRVVQLFRAGEGPGSAALCILLK